MHVRGCVHWVRRGFKSRPVCFQCLSSFLTFHSQQIPTNFPLILFAEGLTWWTQTSLSQDDQQSVLTLGLLYFRFRVSGRPEAHRGIEIGYALSVIALISLFSC